MVVKPSYILLYTTIYCLVAPNMCRCLQMRATRVCISENMCPRTTAPPCKAHRPGIAGLPPKTSQ